MKTIILLTSLLAASTMAQIQQFGGKGSVDWGAGSITAKGIGAPNPNMPAVTARPMAIQAARSVALRNALEILKGIQVTSSTTVENHMVTSDLIRKQVQGFISTFKESEPKYMSDKTIEITVTIPMDSKMQETLLPSSITSQAREIVASPSASASGFTGLIIDARGLGAIPALVPKVVDEDGVEVYGSAYVTREFAVKWGMAGYAKTPEQASKNVDRIGKSPGMVKALRATGASKCDLVLSKKDADSVRSAAKSQNFLSNCRVIIVVD